MKYAFFSDPTHGWLKVPIAEIEILAIASDISECSYISADGKFAYLEEDQDAQIFLNAVLAADWFADMEAIRNCTKQFYSDPPSFIRNLRSYNERFVKKSPSIQTKKTEQQNSKIFNF